MIFYSEQNKWTLHNEYAELGEWQIEKQITDIPGNTELLLNNLKHLCVPYFLDIDLKVGKTYKDSHFVTFKETVDVDGYSPGEVKELILQLVSAVHPESGAVFLEVNLGLKALLSFYSVDNRIITEYLPTKEMLNDYIQNDSSLMGMLYLCRPLDIYLYPDNVRFSTYSNIWIPGILPSEGNEELARINGPRFNEMLHIFEKTMCSDITIWQSGLYNVEKYGFPGGYDTTREWGRERDSELKDYIEAQNR